MTAFIGRENDGTGLYFYRARYYSPALQRFISEDPIGLEGGINFYAYVFNGPTNLIDPSGKLGVGAVMRLPSYCNSSSDRKGNILIRFLQTIACDPSNMIPGPAIIKGPTPGMIRQFEKQLADYGRRSLEKSLQSLEERLAEHLGKLLDLKYRSSVEAEISNFKAQIEAIKQVLGGSNE